MAVCLVDGNYQVMRCVYSSGSDLSSASGVQTGGVYKFLKVLYTFRELGDLVVVFDGGRSKRRMDLYPEYKLRPINESVTEEEKALKEFITYTFETLEKLLPRMGIPVVRMMGAEADDVMYRLAEHFLSQSKDDVYVTTDDSDMLQFAAIGARIYRPMKNEFVTPANFVERMGFTPNFYALWKSIIGDKSDNISGVYGVGPVKATKIITDIAPLLKSDFSCEDVIRVLLEWSEKNQKSKIGQSVKGNLDIIRRNIFLVDLKYTEIQKQDVASAYQHSREEAQADVGHVVNCFKEWDFVSLNNWISFLMKNNNK